MKCSSGRHFNCGLLQETDEPLRDVVLPEVNAPTMSVFLAEVAQCHPQDDILLVLDGEGRHRPRDLRIPQNLRLHLCHPTACSSIRWSLSGKRSARSASPIGSTTAWRASQNVG